MGNREGPDHAPRLLGRPKRSTEWRDDIQKEKRHRGDPENTVSPPAVPARGPRRPDRNGEERRGGGNEQNRAPLMPVDRDERGAQGDRAEDESECRAESGTEEAIHQAAGDRDEDRD